MASGSKSEAESLEEYLALQERRTAALTAEIEAQTARDLKEQREENAKTAAREKKLAAVKAEMVLYKKRIVFSEVLADTICRRITGGEMLSEVCQDVTMPERAVVMEWLGDTRYAEFAKDYDVACKNRSALFEDELITIADDSRNDYVDRLNSKTGESFRVLDQEALARSKMRLDMRLKHLKAFNPSRWGDNPDTAGALRDLNSKREPKVIINFLNAAPLPGDAAIIIEHQPGNEVNRQEPIRELVELGKVKVAR
jgi:hypothetical protein